MITPEQIGQALGLTKVILHEDSGKVRITARESVSDAQQKKVQRWFDAKVVDAVPQEVTRRQFKQQLIVSGLIDQVEAAIDAVADPMQKRVVRNWWQESLSFERSHPLVASFGAALGLSSAQIDEAFRAASEL